MAIKPDGSEISFTNTSPNVSGTLYLIDMKYEDLYRMFQRHEYKGETQRQAKNVDGSVATFYLVNGGRPIQFFSDCNANERARNLDPDDNRIDNIYRRFDITRWVFFGEASEKSDIDAFRQVHQDHLTRRARFDAHMEIARGDVSIDFINEELIPETFSFMSSTGLTLSGRPFGEEGVAVSQANLLIERFQPILEYEVPSLDGSTSDCLLGYEIVVERLVQRAARSSSW